MRPAATAVIDIGKTSARVCAIDDRGAAMLTLDRANAVLAAPPYPHFDADGLNAWIIEGLRKAALEFDVQTIVPVTHGACAALVDDHDLALPIIDYEFEGVREFDAEYDRLARDFRRTYSPALPAGLNLARQLFWLARKFPDQFARATILTYPQYWAWRLCGARSCEATSLGCHTDLWEPIANRFSRLARNLGWNARFGRRVEAWSTLGPLTEEARVATGISQSCAVLAGIHDSNASYLAYRATRRDPFCVVSTGTWSVMMAYRAPLDGLAERRDILVNVDAYGEPAPTARFMGGREYAAISGQDGLAVDPSRTDLDAALETGALAIPAFSKQGGPFREHPGRIDGAPPESPRARAATAAIYCALMTDYCLDLLGARGDVIVEGRFAANEAFRSLLAALRPDRVFRSADRIGTLRGAAALSMLARGLKPHAAALIECVPADDLKSESVRVRWRSLLPQVRHFPSEP